MEAILLNVIPSTDVIKNLAFSLLDASNIISVPEV
jgi:hypothetical protein